QRAECGYGRWGMEARGRRWWRREAKRRIGLGTRVGVQGPATTTSQQVIGNQQPFRPGVRIYLLHQLNPGVRIYLLHQLNPEVRIYLLYQLNPEVRICRF